MNKQDCFSFGRYSRDESKITAWENTMKAKAEARMRRAQVLALAFKDNLDRHGWINVGFHCN
jgi:hypothetical protein